MSGLNKLRNKLQQTFLRVCVCVLPVSVLLMFGGDTISTALPDAIPECTTGPSTEGELSP